MSTEQDTNKTGKPEQEKQYQISESLLRELKKRCIPVLQQVSIDLQSWQTLWLHLENLKEVSVEKDK